MIRTATGLQKRETDIAHNEETGSSVSFKHFSSCLDRKMTKIVYSFQKDEGLQMEIFNTCYINAVGFLCIETQLQDFTLYTIKWETL